jgi:hypothetical protein
MKHFFSTSCLAALLLGMSGAQARLPAPSDEAKAKAAEATAKTAHGNKLANFQLCKSMDKVAVGYFTQSKKDGKAVKPADKTDACADPGAFVYTPPAPASGAAPAAVGPAAVPAVAKAPAAAAAPKK